MNPTWPDVLGTLIQDRDLDSERARWAMERIIGGEASDAQIAAFAVALRAKGETASEIESLVSVLLEHANPLPWAGRALDIVGTGGDLSHTVNLSTMSAIVCAAAGATVVKHGNRAASSSCGSADVLAELGVVIDLSADKVAQSIDSRGIGFCFAPVFHPSLRHAVQVRRDIGIPTVFNILGPLVNPVQPAAQLVGAADLRLAPLMAQVFADRGVDALVVRGQDGLDEVTTCAATDYWEVSGGKVRAGSFDVAELGVPRATLGQLRGGDAATNAAIARSVLGGEHNVEIEAVRDALKVNAAAALAVWNADDRPLITRVAAQMDVVDALLDSGSPLALLDDWSKTTQSLSLD